MESKDGEAGIWLDASLQGRIGAYAARESMTPGEALSALLYLGLEFAERQRTGLARLLAHEILTHGGSFEPPVICWMLLMAVSLCRAVMGGACFGEVRVIGGWRWGQV